jgi:flagellar protein FlbD
LDLIGNRQEADIPCDGPGTAYQPRIKTTKDGCQLILVTRINGAVFALNPDMIERAECTPDTVVTLVDGTKYVIAESVPEFIDSVRHYRASLIAQASRLETEPTAFAQSSDDDNPDALDAKVLPLHRKER